MIKKGIFSAFFFLGFLSLPVLADEIEPTDTSFEETSLNEEGNLSSDSEIDEQEPNPIDEPEPEPIIKNGFIEEEGNIYYYVEDEKQVDQQYIDGYWYYFDPESGVMSKGFINLPNQNKKVYFDQDGRMVYGYHEIEGKGYYFNTSTGKNEYTGVVKNNINDQWYFVRNGVGETFTGWSKSIENGNWYFTRNGVLDWGFTGVAQSVENNKWYHGKNGQLDWSFIGISQSVADKNWYFSYKGELNWSFTGVAKSIFNNEWYHCKNGKVDWGFTGVSKSIENGNWYHSKNGKLDWKFTGISQSIFNQEWYFSYKGKLNWSFTGIANSIANGKWYHCKNGQVDWKFTGLSQSVENKEWYYSKNGRLDWGYTGLGTSIANGKLYYVKNGKLDWKYTSVYEKGNQLYYVKDGAVKYGDFTENRTLYRANAKTGILEAAIHTGANKYHVSQLDNRWRYAVMGGYSLGATGCGPSALAMIFNELSGSYSYTTHSVASELYRAGYYNGYWGGGMIKEGIAHAGNKYGFQTKNLGFDNYEAIKKELLKGNMVAICLTGSPFLQSFGSHELVIYGYDTRSNQCYMMDPYYSHNNRTYDLRYVFDHMAKFPLAAGAWSIWK